MGTPKFTEGPWSVNWQRDEENGPFFNVLKQDVDADDYGRMIDASYSIIEMAYPVIDEEEAKANANLIAAAPDLYDALNALRAAIAEITSRANIGWWPQLDDAMLRAARSLTYARGEDDS